MIKLILSIVVVALTVITTVAFAQDNDDLSVLQYDYETALTLCIMDITLPDCHIVVEAFDATDDFFEDDIEKEADELYYNSYSNHAGIDI